MIPMMLLTGIAVLAVAGCAGGAGAEETPDGRTFISVTVDGDQIPGGGPLVVGFDHGRLSASAGCNHGSGPVDLTGGVVAVPQLALTMRACPPPIGDADGWMARLFDARPRWTLAGDTLTLITDAATVTLRDKQVVTPDRSLTDTTWLVRSLISPQAITSSLALERASPSLSIAADGAVAGWTGCNRMTGRADLSGTPDTITFGPPAVTRMACPDGRGEIEQAMLRVLDGPVQATIDADELRLKRADGYGLVLLAH